MTLPSHTQSPAKMLRTVDGNTARPTKSELDRIKRVYASFNQKLPEKWTPDSVRKAKGHADILEGMLKLFDEDKKKRRAKAEAAAVSATGAPPPQLVQND